MREWTPIKFKKVIMRQGYAPKKAWTGILDWSFLMKKFNLHKGEIYRKRKNQGALRIAVKRFAHVYKQ